MAKNRKTNSGTTTQAPIEEDEEYFSEYTGEQIDLGNLSSDEMEVFVDKMNGWLHYYSENPDEELTEKELEYISNHLLSTSDNPDVPDGHVYRFENAYHFDDGDYKVGDKLNYGTALRSFSKDVSATNLMLNNRFNGYTNITIYRTVGKTPYFNVGEYSNPYPEQEECLVPIDTMRVKAISKFSGPGNMRDKIMAKYGIDLGSYDYVLEHVTVVDVSYDDKVGSVSTIDGGSLELKNNF